MLEERIKALTSFCKKYKSTIKYSAMVASLPLLFSFYYSEGIAQRLTIKSKIEKAKKENREIRSIHKGNLLKPEIKNCIEIIDSDTREFKEEYHPSKRMEHHYLLTLPIILGALYALSKKGPYDKLLGELSTNEKVIRTGIELGVTGATFAVFKEPLSMLEPMPFLCVGAMIPSFTVPFTMMTFNKYKIWQRYRKAKQEGNNNEIAYRFYNYLHLEKEAKSALQSGDLSKAAQILHEKARIERGLDDTERKCFSYYQNNIGKELMHIFSRRNARKNPNYENYLRLLLNDLKAIDTPVVNDLEEAIQKLPKKELELKLIAGALTTDNDKKKKWWSDVYKILDNGGKIKPVDEKSKNEVGFADCDTLGVRFVVKRQDYDSHKKEIEQTRVRYENMTNNRRIVIPEVVHEFEDGKKGVFISTRLYGESFYDFLRGMPTKQQILWLRYALDGGHEAAKYSNCSCNENRHEKTAQDIEKLVMIEREIRKELSTNICACLRYVDMFEPICDMDLIKDNFLVLDDEKIALIDHEERKISDPSYMLIKLLEYKPTIDYSEEGVEARNELIHHHFTSLGYNLDERIMEAHYYHSVVLKAISYLGFSEGMEGKKEVRRGYLNGAEKALELVVNRYSSGQSNEQIRQIHAVFKSIKRIKTQLGFAILT